MGRKVTAVALALVVFAHAAMVAAARTRPGREDVRARARAYEPLIAAAASEHGVDARLLWTVAYLETRFRPHLTSPAGAGGLCQLMPATAARFGVTNRYDARQSLDGAARYLRVLSKMFDGRLDLVLAGYNAGEGAVLAFRDGRSIRLPNGRVINPRRIQTGGIPPYAETRNYVALGREVYAGVAGAEIFRGPGPAMSSPGVAESAEVKPAAPRPSRTIYFGDGGTPPRRAVELPDEHEIATVFGEGASVPTRERAVTRTIRFR